MKSVMKSRNDSVLKLIVSCLFGGVFVALLLLEPLQTSSAQSCSFAISHGSQNFAYGGGTGSVEVTASSASCNWSATSNASWVSVTSGASGMGNGVIVYSVTSNLAASNRTGTLTIAGQVFTVTQDAGQNGLMFYPLPTPIRLLDTRAGATVGCDTPGAPIAADTSRTQTAAGRTCSSVTIPATARALTGHVTTVQSEGGFLTLYSSDAAKPFVASTNYQANQIVNNVFTVGLGAADGAFKIYAFKTTDVVIDVTGYYAPPGDGGLYFHPLPKPIRLLETRQGQTGCDTPGAQLGASSTRTQATAGRICDNVTIPANAKAVTGNATVVAPASNGFLTLFPSNATQPFVASSNYPAGQTVNGPFTVGLGPDGAFKMFALATTDLVVDLSGFFAPAAINQAPLADAGPDKITSAPSNTAALTGAASDDGLPSNSLTVSWSKVSGPGTVNFSAPNSVTTNATFSQQGSYVLRLTANDSQLAATDDVTVTVNPPLAVNAGMD